MLEQKTLSQIFDICVPNAKDSEFQVHYRSLTFECTNDNNNGIIYFTVPTVFYNMPQEVNSVAIDFHTDEIYENGEMVKPLSMAVAGTPEISSIMGILSAQFDNVELTEIADNSFHRHPGRSTFSSTDYDNDPEEPGVIYRKGNCENLLQTDSVMYLGNKAELVVTESRIATVNKATDGTVTAKYVEIPTKVYMREVEDNAIRRMFGVEPKEHIDCMNSALLKDNYDQLDDMVNKMFKVLPEPSLDFIDPEVITQKVVEYRNYYKPDKKDNKKDEVPDNGKDFLSLMFDQAEKDIAFEYGYDLTDEKDVDEWMSYREFFMNGGYEL